MKYGNLNLGQIEAIVNKFGGMEMVKKFLSDEIVLSEPEKKWREENGVIYFWLTSDGTSGRQWLSRFKKAGIIVSEEAKKILCSKDFKPTNGVSYLIAVFKESIFKNGEDKLEDVWKEITNRNVDIPNYEVACLIREKFSYKELKKMGLSHVHIIIEPLVYSFIIDSNYLIYNSYYGAPSFYDHNLAFIAQKKVDDKRLKATRSQKIIRRTLEEVFDEMTRDLPVSVDAQGFKVVETDARVGKKIGIGFHWGAAKMKFFYIDYGQYGKEYHPVLEISYKYFQQEVVWDIKYDIDRPNFIAKVGDFKSHVANTISLLTVLQLIAEKEREVLMFYDK